MTYSYYIRTSKNNKVDWDSLTEKEQEQIGQMIFRIMLESSGRYREEQMNQEKK